MKQLRVNVERVECRKAGNSTIGVVTKYQAKSTSDNVPDGYESIPNWPDGTIDRYDNTTGTDTNDEVNLIDNHVSFSEHVMSSVIAEVAADDDASFA